jgi:beta-lactam-binding protein with PASTA domain
VPYLGNLSLNDATQELQKNNLLIGSTTYIDSMLAFGLVVSQSPSAGRQVDRMTRVDVTLSKGPVQAKSVDLNLGDFTSDDDGLVVTVKITQVDLTQGVDSDVKLIRETSVGRNTNPLSFQVSGYKNDIIEWRLYVNDVLKKSGNVDFK